MHRMQQVRGGVGLGLVIGCAVLTSCAGPLQGSIRGNHHGDYTTLPAHISVAGRSEVRPVSASVTPAGETAFEGRYQQQVDRLGSAGTAAQSCLDFLAGCFATR
jgi:hypothetical protein